MTRGRSTLWVPAACALLVACTMPGAPGARRPADPLAGLASTPGHPDLVVLLSVSGLTPAAYRVHGGGSPAMPTLAALARAGASADEVVPVTPASRWPAHTSLVTGRLPARHGIPADHLLGERGVRSAFFTHASQMEGPTLWSAAAEAGQRVAVIGWPASVGATIELLLPDIPSLRRGRSWLVEIADTSTPWLFDLAQRNGGGDPETAVPGAARDATLARVACGVAVGAAPPRLLLLQLSQTAPVLAREGPDSEAARAALGRADAEIERLLRCLREADLLRTTALVVVGDHGTVAVHTELRPNAVLERAALLSSGDGAAGLRGWRAVARSNGGSAFVYARSEGDAVRARRALADEAERSGVFRVVSADEMLRLGADPEAWFGLEARPGYVFSDAAAPPLRRPSTLRGSGGYLSDQPRMGPGFVAWGRGLRGGVRIPWMRQIDVAPTVARLLGLRLHKADGAPVVGALSLGAGSATSAEEAGR